MSGVMPDYFKSYEDLEVIIQIYIWCILLTLCLTKMFEKNNAHNPVHLFHLFPYFLFCVIVENISDSVLLM